MVKLRPKTFYVNKDQKKADVATKFIGRGSIDSSTNSYSEDFGALANSGKYVSTDVVFVSAEGARKGRLNPDFHELHLAALAGVTFITDTPIHRERPYNIGERQVATWLLQNNYTETRIGVWNKS